MEKKNVQRIVGVLVIVALVIVVMPLMFGKNDLPAQQVTSMKAPPFPDQDQGAQEGTLGSNKELAGTTDAVSQDPNDPSNNVEITPAMSQDINDTTNIDNQAATSDINGGVNTTSTPEIQAEAPATAAPTAANSVDSSPIAAPAPLSADVKPAVAPVATATQAATPAAPAPAEVATITPAPVPAPIELGAKTPATTIAENTETTAVIPTPNAVVAPQTTIKKIDVNSSSATMKHADAKQTYAPAKKVKAHVATATTSAKVKGKSWVIQVGAFKVKSNAVRLTDKLRASGYKAFFHDVKTASGKVNTHVYVGPETKVASAVKLSGKVRDSLNLQGIIVPYKPLAI